MRNLALSAFVCFALGCVPVQALVQAKAQMDVNRGHSQDVGLPEPARLIAEDAEDAFAAQLYLLDGTRMPSHVEDRIRARGDLPEGYDK